MSFILNFIKIKLNLTQKHSQLMTTEDQSAISWH